MIDLKAQEQKLLKFFVISSVFFFIGTVHGVLQVVRPIRAWLDSIGSPYGGPGHMIDPLAHAHINVVGGVAIFLMGATYFLFQRITDKPLFSYKLVEHSFWWTSLGLIGFYSTLMIFGYIEGTLLLNDGELAAQEFHKYYGPTISVVATVMGIGFWVYFANVFLTYKQVRKGNG